VPFSKKVHGATCKRCLKLAADGHLERLTLKKNAEGITDGRNQHGNPRLTEMQRKFAAHAMVSTNPRKAALDAGYSEKYSKSHASALRTQLAPLIMEFQEIAKRRAGISVAKVQTELASMGFANVVDYFDISDNGRMMPKRLNELTREQAAAIQEVKLVEVEVEDDDGSITKEFRIGWLKLADKRANLVDLGKTLGMFNKIVLEDKREATVLLGDVPTDALEEAEALLLAAVSKAKSEKGKRSAIEGEFKELPPPGAVESEKP